MKRVNKVLWGMIALTCSVMIYYFLNGYLKQSQSILKAYLKALNHKDYKVVSSLIYKEGKLKNYKEEEVTDFLKAYFESKNFIGVTSSKEQVELSQQDTPYHFYEVDYIFQNQSVTSRLSLVQVEEGWKVIFPFKVEDVHIYAPLGSRVWFGESTLTQTQANQYTVSNVLPGDYLVRIEFINSMYSDYTTTIHVPAETQVLIPYETVDVNIECMPGTVVELAGEKRVNQEGVVQFNHVLEGTYTLKVYDLEGYLVTYEKEITLSKENTSFHIEELKLSQKGDEQLRQCINQFYQDYLEGIKKHTSDFISEYAVDTVKAEMIDTFEVWFIENKNLETAQIDVEMSPIHLDKEGVVQVQAQEIVEMTNQEEGPNGGVDKRDYQVLLTWQMAFVREGESYKIKDRRLQESLVSYKDSKGRWIAY